MPDWLNEIFIGYGPVGAWLGWQLLKDHRQQKVLSEMAKAMQEHGSAQAATAQAISDVRSFLLNRRAGE